MDLDSDDGLSDISESELFEALDRAKQSHDSQPREPPPKRPKLRPRPRTKSPLFKSPPPPPQLANPDAPWVTKHAPQSADQVAVSPKKFAETYNHVLEALTRGVTRVMVLSGPSGASKSATLDHVVRNVERELRRKVVRVDWANPAFLSHVPAPQAFHRAVSQFMLLRQDPDQVHLVAVEDLPNIMHAETRDWFRRAVDNYLNISSDYVLAPLVFVITESDNTEAQSFAESYTAESIFSRDILGHSRLKRVKFPAVPMSFMRKPLLEILAKEAPSHVVVKSTKALPRKLVLASGSCFGPCLELAYVIGDVRSAVNALEFLFKSGKVGFSKKPSGGKAATVDEYLRPDNVSFFRAMGRVFYGTKKDTSKIDHDVIGGLLNQWGDDFGARNNMTDYLFALGLKHAQTLGVEFVQDMAEAHSLAETMTLGNLSSADSIEFILRYLHHLFVGTNFPKTFGSSSNYFKRGIDARKDARARLAEVDEEVRGQTWKSRESWVLYEDFYTKEIRGAAGAKAGDEGQVSDLTGNPYTMLIDIGEKMDPEDDCDLLEAMGLDDDEW